MWSSRLAPCVPFPNTPRWAFPLLPDRRPFLPTEWVFIDQERGAEEKKEAWGEGLVRLGLPSRGRIIIQAGRRRLEKGRACLLFK